MGLRWAQGAYTPGGRYHASVARAMQPVFESGRTSPISAFVLLAMASSSFVCHYNAPLFKTSLTNPTTGRFSLLSGLGFGASATVCLLASAFGFLTFGGNCSGMILNNYSLADPLATVARGYTGLSILFGYPLMMAGLRSSIFELMQGSSGVPTTLPIW